MTDEIRDMQLAIETAVAAAELATAVEAWLDSRVHSADRVKEMREKLFEYRKLQKEAKRG